MKSPLDILGAQLSAPPEPPPRYVGVYFLIHRDVIVYIGQSKDIVGRLYGHRLQRDVGRKFLSFVFDRWAWIPVDEKDLNLYEGALIRCLRPKYNAIATRVDLARADALLVNLGLPTIAPEYRDVYWLLPGATERQRQYARGARKKRAA